MIEPYLIANLNVDIDLSKLCGPPINSGVCVFVVVHSGLENNLILSGHALEK